MRTIQSEFPDYDGEELALAPFRCEPWHNDFCPRYVWRGSDHPIDIDLLGCELTLWADYVDPAKREVQTEQRLQFVIENGEADYPLAVFFAETEDELRERLNTWYVRVVGYRPDDDFRRAAGENLPLGELLHLVGSVIFLRHKEGLS